jgi:outer membrane protein assembly factor BamB
MRARQALRSTIIVLATCIPSGPRPFAAAPAVCTPAESSTWTVPVNIRGEAVVDGTTAFALTRQHEVIAVDVRNGRVEWRRPTGETDGTTQGTRLVLSPGIVVAGDGGLVGLDRSTGAQRWRLPAVAGDVPGLHLGETARGLVFTGSLDSRVMAVDLQSGLVRWSTRFTERREVVAFAPVTDGSSVAALFTEPGPPDTGGVVVLDAASGRVRWQAWFPRAGADAPATYGAAGLALADDLALAVSGDGRIHAYGMGDGSLRWSLPGARAEGRPWTRDTDQDLRALLVAGRRLIAGSLTGVVTAYDLDTREVAWEYYDKWNGSTALRLGAVGTLLLVPHFSGHVVGLDLATGQERWRRGDWQAGYLWPPVPLDGHLLFTGAEAGMVSFRCEPAKEHER